MFSNWISRIGSSLVQAASPKAFLASCLASSLNEFFQVDVNQIESNLLSDTKIVLKQVHLKPLPFDNGSDQSYTSKVLTLVGQVDEIVFSWTWGGSEDGSTSFIRETMLTIRGARFRVEERECEQPTSNASREPSQQSSSYQQTDNSVGYIQRHVQQIIDHLTLNITDLEVVVECGELPSNPNAGKTCLVVEASSLQLISFGREGNSEASTQGSSSPPPLSQRISLNSLGAYITTTGQLDGAIDSTSFGDKPQTPLLEPFGYAASVKRVAGRRFMDGIADGLEVIGEIVASVASKAGQHRGKRAKDTGKMVLRAGSLQVQVLSKLINLLLPVAKSNSASLCDASSQEGKLDEAVAASLDESTSNLAIPSTTFLLPLPSVVLWLPNDSMIQLPNCTLQYHMDSTVLSVYGTEGIHVNGAHEFLQVSENTRWMLDFAHSKASLERQTSSDPESGLTDKGPIATEDNFVPAMAHIYWEEAELKKLVVGLCELLSLVAFDPDNHQRVVPSQAMTASQPWSIGFDGIICLRVQGREGWVDASIDSTSVTLLLDDEGLPSDFTLGQIVIGPTSFGACSVRLPPLIRIQESRDLVFQGHGEAELQSFAVANTIYEFLVGSFNVSHNDKMDSPQGSKCQVQQAVRFPFSLCMPNVIFSLLEPGVGVVAEGITIEDATAQCRSLRITTKQPDVNAVFAGIRATLGPSINVSVATVETLSTGGMAEIAQPIHDLAFGFSGGTLQVDLPLLRVITPMLKDCLHVCQSQEIVAQASPPMSLPFPIHLRINEIGVKHSKQSKSYLRLNSINITATPMKEALLLTSSSVIGLYLQAPDTSWVKASVGDLSVILDPLFSPKEVKCNGFEIGPSSFGKLIVKVPSFATTSAMRVLHIVGDAEVSISSAHVANKLQQMVLDAFEYDVTNATPQGKAVGIPMEVSIPGLKLDLIDQQMKLDVRNLMMEGSTLQIGSVFFTSCVMSTALSGVQVSLGPSVVVMLQKIDNFHVPGLVTLDEPIFDVRMNFENDVLCTTFQSMSLVVSETLWLSGSQHPQTGSLANTIWLPFPLRVHVDHLRLKGVGGKNGLSIQIDPVDLLVVQKETCLSVANHAVTSIRVASSNAEYIDLYIDEPTVNMALSSEGLKLRSTNAGRIHIGPTSHGHLSVDAASFSMDTESITLSGDEPLNISLQSVDVVTKLQDMLMVALGRKGQAASLSGNAGTNPLSLPLFVHELNLKIAEPSAELVLKSIHLYESNLHCALLRFTESGGVSVSASYLDASQGDCAQVLIRRIETLTIPEGFYLYEPICSSRLIFMDGVLQLSMPSASLVLAPAGSTARATKPTIQREKEAIPFPVQLIVQDVDIRVEGKNAISARVSQINAIAVPVKKALSIENASPVSIRVQTSDAVWIDGRVNGLTALISPCDAYSSNVTCAGILLGPSSMGHISVEVPPFSMNEELEISVNGTVGVVLQSTEVVERLQKFASCLVVNPQSSPPAHGTLKAILPKVKVEIMAEPRVRAIFDSVRINHNNLSIEKLVISDPSGMAACLSGITATVAPQISGGVKWIEKLIVPNAFRLSKPTGLTTFSFTAANLLHINLTSLHLVLLEASTQTSKGSVSVPFHIRVTLKEMNVRTGPTATESTCLRLINCHVKPAESDSSPHNQPPGVVFQLAMKSVENTLMNLQKVRVAGMVYDGQANTIHRLHLAADSLAVVAGFSIADWTSMMIGEQKEETVLILPHSCVEPLHAKMSYKGTLVATKETHVQVPAFFGGPGTTSKHLVQHITQSILVSVPSFLANTELLGENALDVSAKMVGQAVMQKSVTGSLGGSVVGLVAADSVRGIVASGKQSRNASENEGYKFGDFTRGLFHATKQSSKKGGELRRGDSAREYSLGDFSVGAAHSTGKYVVENKSRLAAAGGSGLGMTVGLALAGPAGWAVAGIAGVAGAYAGSKVGASAFDDEPRNNPTEANARLASSQPTALNQSSQAPRHVTTVHQTPLAQNSQLHGVAASPNRIADEDLLGLGLAGNEPFRNQTEWQLLTPSNDQLNVSSNRYGTEDLLGLEFPVAQANPVHHYSAAAATTYNSQGMPVSWTTSSSPSMQMPYSTSPYGGPPSSPSGQSLSWQQQQGQDRHNSAAAMQRRHGGNNYPRDHRQSS